jgi:hypothetical protein
MRCNVVCTALHVALFGKHCENNAMPGKNVCEGHHECGQALIRYRDALEGLMALGIKND